MILHCSLFLMFISCAWSDHSHDYAFEEAFKSMQMKDYSSWPSFLNAYRRTREVKSGVPPVGMSEGGGGVVTQTQTAPGSNRSVPEPIKLDQQLPEKTKQETEKPESAPNMQPSIPSLKPVNATTQEGLKPSKIESGKNATMVVKQLDLHDPGVLTRGLIVFGGFTLIAVAYYVFYRKKGSKNENSNSHSANDANQFRYGVLQSDDQQGNLELSRVPLTMESDDDDDDEDMEIFDIGQKKKSMVFVDLQGNDENVVFQKTTESQDDSNLLLDLEDASTDPILNWNNPNANKSIL